MFEKCIHNYFSLPTILLAQESNNPIDPNSAQIMASTRYKKWVSCSNSYDADMMLLTSLIIKTERC